MVEKTTPTVGLCMIVRNSAHLLPRILDKLAPSMYAESTVSRKFNQVVIVDTGSTDGTLKLLSRYPWVEVHSMEWKFDFSIARNEALSHIKTDMWMWLDSDDTFTEESLARWFEIADEMWAKRAEPECAVYALLPYFYRVDANGYPEVTHFRERIMLGGPADWEWREPLHEVCVYKHPGGTHCTHNDCPVVHKPDYSTEDYEKGNSDRNWKIMLHHYLNGDRTDRTLYYVSRMANVVGQYEFALDAASTLAERNAGGYYEYEALVACGEAYSELYKRDAIEEYKTRAMDYLTRAKRYEPQRNEARIKLCDLHIMCKDTDAALVEANGLNEALPATVATTLTAQYGKYKYSVLAMINFRLTGNIWNAMLHHMEALDCPKPHASSVDLDVSIRGYLEDNDIGVIYCDEKYNGYAMAMRKSLREKGHFRDVLVFNDPRCVSFARNIYAHFSEKEDSFYKEDGHPRLRKFAFTPYATEQSGFWKMLYGYERTWMLPNTPAELDCAVDAIYAKQETIFATTIAEGLNGVLHSRYAKVLVVLCGGLVIPTSYFEDYEEQHPVLHGTVRVTVNKLGELVAMSGYTDSVASIYIDDSGIMRVWNTDAVEVRTMQEEDRQAQGVKWRVEKAPDSGKKCVIMAPGIEEWDGTTPRRWGIGASESCVIYMAEQLRRRGHNVTVYCTTSRSCIIAGVAYMNIGQYYTDSPLPDLFVSSRVPEFMQTRRGKLQVLWMHDIPEAYLPRINNSLIIDRYIAISQWQASQCARLNFKQSKVHLIPNGVVNWPSYSVQRVKGRSIWVSQPERGVDNLHKMWQEKPNMFKDCWVVYGFYNLLNYAKGNVGRTTESFVESTRFKYALKQMGAKIVGRVPHWQVQHLAQTCERWLYPSTFPETFCVAGLEALHNGVQCYYTRNGATDEVLEGACIMEKSVPRRVRVFDDANAILDTSASNMFVYDRDASAWFNAVDTYAGVNDVIGFVADNCYWPRVADKWEELLNGN